MTFEEYNGLDDEQKKAFFTGLTDNTKKLDDLTAEVTSLKKELEENRIVIDNGKKELAATKELNYTLARKVNTQGEHKSFEDTLHDVFGRKENKEK